jgi:hypothetical protein
MLKYLLKWETCPLNIFMDTLVLKSSMLILFLFGFDNDLLSKRFEIEMLRIMVLRYIFGDFDIFMYSIWIGFGFGFGLMIITSKFSIEF